MSDLLAYGVLLLGAALIFVWACAKAVVHWFGKR